VSVWRVDGLGVPWVPWVRGLVGLALLAAPAEAQRETPSGVTADATATPSAPARPLSIWYRSSEGCPEGSVFLARLAELGRPASLARVGDRVDFVVTVARAQSSSSGRLERQTARGTVAIRELEAPGCEEVTAALALSLEIALDPANEAPVSSAAAQLEGSPAGARSPSGGGASRAPSTPPRPGRAADRRQEDPGRESTQRGAFAIGAQGSLMKGIAQSWAPGGSLFAELRAQDEIDLAGRLSLGAALASDTLSTIDVHVLWLAGRAEGCAFELRSGSLSVQPCAGAELGVVRAGSSGGAARQDAGLWAAAVGLVRASFELDESLALEAQVGAALPFVRYALGSSLGGDLFRTEAVSLALALGGRWSP
jgi:hypothetical protein